MIKKTGWDACLSQFAETGLENADGGDGGGFGSSNVWTSDELNATHCNSRSCQAFRSAASCLRPFRTSSVYRDEWWNHPLLCKEGGSHASPYFT